jgi:hypothetical protein
VRLSWVHEFKPDRAINASLIALPAAAFTVDGPHAGAKLALAPNAWLFASFDGEFSSRSQSYAGKGGARVTCGFAERLIDSTDHDGRADHVSAALLSSEASGHYLRQQNARHVRARLGV